MFHLSVVTPEKSIYEGDISLLVAPAVTGEIGILTNHQPIVTKLSPGGLRLKLEDGTESVFFVSGGYLEFLDNKATILADIVEDIDAIQLEEATEARKRAQELLKNSSDAIDRERLEEEIRLQMVRERFAQVSKFKKL